MNRRFETPGFVWNGSGYFVQNNYRQPYCALYKSDDMYSHVYAIVQDGKYRKTFDCACPTEFNFWLEAPYKNNLSIFSYDFMNSAIFIAIAAIIAFDDAKITLITSDKNIEKQSFFDVLSVSEGMMEINDIEKRVDTFFIFDGRSLLSNEKNDIRKLLENSRSLNGAIIDEQDTDIDNIIPRMIVTADTFSIDDFIFKVLSDNGIRERLGRDNWTRFSEYFVSTNDVERVGRFIEAIDTSDKEEAIMPGNESLIKLLLDNLGILDESIERFPIFSKLIHFLVEKGDRYRSRYSYEKDCNLGDIFDPSDFEKSIRLILSLLESGYRAEDFEIYRIVSEFIDIIIQSRGSYLPSPDVVYGYFERLSALIAEDAYFYRDEGGTSLLMRAERLLNLQKSYWKIYELILEHTEDAWLINAKGENAFRNINISLYSKYFDVISNKDIGNSFDNSGEFNVPCFSREHLTALRKEKFPDIALIPAVASAVCFCSEPLKTEYFEYLMELIASCKDINKAVFRNDGENILMRMISYNTPKAMLEAVLEAGIDINAVDWDGNTALVYASIYCNNNPWKISWIVEHGIDATIQNKLGETAVNIVARKFSIHESEWGALGEIKDRKAFLLADNYGYTPVMTAFRYMNLPAIRFLLSNGYYQSSDISYIRHQIERVKTSSVRNELEDLFQKYVAEDRI